MQLETLISSIDYSAQHAQNQQHLYIYCSFPFPYLNNINMYNINVTLELCLKQSFKFTKLIISTSVHLFHKDLCLLHRMSITFLSNFIHDV